MFDINNKTYTTYEVNNTVVYEIKDFYKYPDKIVSLTSKIKPRMHKEDEKPSYNGEYFFDMRHSIPLSGMDQVTDFLSSICKQKPRESRNNFSTNLFKFIEKGFNLSNDYYWYPHVDYGYTALIYLNDFSYPGTNIYNSDHFNTYGGLEHYTPWKEKSDWKLETTIKAEYNKLVFFDGLRNPHSMAVSKKFFYKDFRLNQVVFFNEN